jgi:hypothetical protein
MADISLDLGINRIEGEANDYQIFSDGNEEPERQEKPKKEVSGPVSS